MIEQSGDLDHFLPISYRTPKEEEYVRFLWEAFYDNCNSGKFQFAFLAYHMLTMSFVYFNIWQIKLIDPKGFATAMVGFNKDMERDLLAASSPFVFSVVNERTVLRFLKLIQCDNGKIGAYAKLVDDRNDTAHSNGNIFFATEAALEIKVNEILRAAAEIQAHSKPMIEIGYRAFLLASRDQEERQFVDDADQIREGLIHENYLSAKDIGYCRMFDIEALNAEDGFPVMKALHEKLSTMIPADELEPA